MKQVLLLIVFTGFFSIVSPAQFSWQQTPLMKSSNRYDDMYWRNPQLGWTIDFAGAIHKTTDGGQTWQTLTGPTGFYYRSVGFMTDQVGFIGKLQPSLIGGADTFLLYKTVDGGSSWTGVNMPWLPRADQGFCGMSVVNDSVMMAVGKYSGPAAFYRTTDQGQTWTFTDLSAYAGGLVDCKFWTPDSGIVVGSSGDFFLDSGVILFTADGGQTWSVRHTTAHTEELCWKITFPSRRVGYVSIEDFNGGDLYCVKTTDGGQTWQEVKYATNTTYNAEGIGFINDSNGWIGGGYNTVVHETTDGGQTWTPLNKGRFVNRFRVFGDTLAYTSGEYVWKISPQALAANPDLMKQQEPVSYFPNPATDHCNVLFTLTEPGFISLTVTNSKGQVGNLPLPQQYYAAGTHRVQLPMNLIPPGHYVARLRTAKGVRTQQLVVQR